MKNSFGSSITLTVFGESHGECIGAVLDGMPAGIKVDDGFIRHQLSRRRPSGAVSTSRVEADKYSIVSGVFGGFTTGTPICIIIPNTGSRSADYDLYSHVARPGHADFTAYCKYHGFQDFRGGGHFSGRITAAAVAAGAIVISALGQAGIRVGTHILRLGDVSDRPFCDISEDISRLSSMNFPVLDAAAAERMTDEVLLAKQDGDSIGGILQTAVTGLPAGVGEPMFDTFEGVLSHALFAVPGIKGVQFGSGFEGCTGRGSSFNDSFCISDGAVRTRTNNSGGINGGITNGMPVVFSCAVRPTPSISKKQETVDFVKKEETTVEITGRHDPAIIHRAAVVVDSITAIAAADLLAQRFGTDHLIGGGI